MEVGSRRVVVVVEDSVVVVLGSSVVVVVEVDEVVVGATSVVNALSGTICQPCPLMFHANI